MQINSQHWLEDAIIEPVAGGDAMLTRRCVVVHFTKGATALSSIRYWRTKAARGASAHVVVDRDGKVYQCRPFNKTCGHAGGAGRARWRDPKTNVLYEAMNRCSIGVEIANAGDDEALARKWSSLPLTRAKHRNESVEKEWETYPPAQISAVTKVVSALVDKYNLDDITGHDCIAPERKNDPGPAFPMQALREYCNFKGLPVVFWPKK